MQFLAAHYPDLPQLIKAKIIGVNTEKAKEDNRYELNEGDMFGIATVEFTTKKK